MKSLIFVRLVFNVMACLLLVGLVLLAQSFIHLDENQKPVFIRKTVLINYTEPQKIEEKTVYKF